MKKSKKKANRGAKGSEDGDDEEGDEGWNKVSGAKKFTMFAADAEITIDLVVKKLNEIMAARGKKNTNRKEQIELLNKLAKIGESHNLGSCACACLCPCSCSCSCSCPCSWYTGTLVFWYSGTLVLLSIQA